jgi:hypothetical protein
MELDSIQRFFRGRSEKFRITVPGAETLALIFGGGTNTQPITTATAGVNFVDFRTKTTDATGADSRGLYWRHYLGGASGSGESARLYTTVDAAGAVAAHGSHMSVSFGTSGTLTGQAAAARATLQVPNKSLGGTAAAVYAELSADGASSTIGGNVSFLRAVLAGNATGAAAIEDAAALIRVEGGTNASGNVVGALNGNEPTWTGKTGLIRVSLNGTVAYLVCIVP